MATRVVPDRSGGEITLPGFPWRFSSKAAEVEAEERDTSEAPVDWRIPAFQGEHNEDVLRELGYPENEITALRRGGVLIRPGLDNYTGVSTEGG
jgi:crotonobetainyl-CoA:carnitine CoA-transferase CaiB-like acyl-CoA transferase